MSLFKRKSIKVASNYYAIVNDVRHEFPSYASMISFIEKYRLEHNEISSLAMFRCDLYNLIS